MRFSHTLQSPRQPETNSKPASRALPVTRLWIGTPALWLGLLVLQLVSFPIRAEHFAITLTIEDAHSKAEAFADSDPPAEGLNSPTVFHAKVAEPLTWQFLLTDVKPHSPFPRLKIVYYLAPRAAAGAHASQSGSHLLEGDFILDLKYQGRVGIRQQFQIDQPGRYLLRVESVNSGSDHEHFSAIEIQVD